MKKYFIAAVLVFTMGLSYAQEPTIGETTKQEKSRSFLYKSLNTPVTAEWRVDTQKKLVIKNGAGFIKVSSGETDKVTVEGNVFTFATSKKGTQKFIKNYLVYEVAEGDDRIVLKSFFRGRETKRGPRYKLGHMLGTPVSKVEMRITVPKGMAIEIHDNSGPIYVNGYVGDVAINDDSGFIEVKHVQGNVSIRDGSGGIMVQEVQGNVSIRDGSGNITVKETAGNLTIRDRSGGISAKEIAGSADIKDTSGGMYLSQIGKSLKIKDASGIIQVRNVALDSLPSNEIYIKDSSGGISLTQAGTSATIYDRSGGIYIREIHGDVRVNDTSGGITVRQIDGRLLVKDRSGKINTDNYVIANGKTKP